MVVLPANQLLCPGSHPWHEVLGHRDESVQVAIQCNRRWVGSSVHALVSYARWVFDLLHRKRAFPNFIYIPFQVLRAQNQAFHPAFHFLYIQPDSKDYPCLPGWVSTGEMIWQCWQRQRYVMFLDHKINLGPCLGHQFQQRNSKGAWLPFVRSSWTGVTCIPAHAFTAINSDLYLS